MHALARKFGGFAEIGFMQSAMRFAIGIPVPAAAFVLASRCETALFALETEGRVCAAKPLQPLRAVNGNTLLFLVMRVDKGDAVGVWCCACHTCLADKLKSYL